VSQANCPEPEPKPDLAQRVTQLREAHDLAAAELCEALGELQASILQDALNLQGSQQAYQMGRSDGRSEMARECVAAIDQRLTALKPGTLAHQALSALREEQMRKAIP
jgi:flagellar biosynthesis/type III secretory pathway protein FliH